MVFALPSAPHSFETSGVVSLASRKADAKGFVFVPEYHHIGNTRGPMFRTAATFRADLERFRKLGFRPVTVMEYATNTMTLPKGASPVAITFDDANPSQLKLRRDGSVDPGCAVGIWMAFAKKHPEFPVKATFYVLPHFFDQREFRHRKFEILRSLGCEIASHTVTHPNLARCSSERVKRELAGAIDRLEKMGLKGPFGFAAPYGLFPRDRSLLKGFKYKGKTYRQAYAALAYYGAGFSPEDRRFSPFAIRRIVCTGGGEGMDDYFSRVRRGKVRLYVSAGPSVVVKR